MLVLLPACSSFSVSQVDACSFYTFSSNAPSSMKPSLTAPKSSKAGAGGQYGFRAGVSQPPYGDMFHFSHREHVLVILGCLALDPGPDLL